MSFTSAAPGTLSAFDDLSEATVMPVAEAAYDPSTLVLRCCCDCNDGSGEDAATDRMIDCNLALSLVRES